MKENSIKYLLVGGYAVSYYGYPRSTANMDIWISMDMDNAFKLVSVLKEFGFNSPEITPELFTKKDKVIRMGVPPMRLEILTTVSGVEFDECYDNKQEDELDGIKINIINKEDLLKNKKAAGRYKDLDDIEHLVQD